MGDLTTEFINAIAERGSNRITGYAIHGGRINCPMVTQMLVDETSGGELWTGGTPAMDFAIVEGFDKILCLYPWESYPTSPDQEKVEVELYDSLDQAFDQIEDLSDLVAGWVVGGSRVLVHCQAGLNRSSLVSAITIRKLTGMSGEDVVARMREKRDSQVLCNSAFEKYVTDWTSNV